MPASPSRIALLAGTTGLIGRALLPLLIESPTYARVHALLRRPAPSLSTSDKLALHTVDFNALPPLPHVDDVFIALGTTIKVAGSEAAFRHVDFDAVVNTARAARSAGATRLAVVSALGADANSRIFYNRVKGEMQQAISQLGYASVVIAQPSLLVGDRSALGQPTRPGEVWVARLLGPVMGLVPASVRPIAAATVAHALLRALHEDRPGVRLLRSGQMQAMPG
ncbi:MAG TPA: NAD(P)H-binding protein [Albitalea sp.]|nr:NAD(P)H-binding protein [Albitalea sp.]